MIRNMASKETKMDIMQDAPGEGSSSVQGLITAEIDKMMEQHDSENPQTINITVVHAMFKRLETSIENRMQEIEAKCRNVTQSAAVKTPITSALEQGAVKQLTTRWTI